MFDLELKAASLSPPNLNGRCDSVLATAGMAGARDILDPRTSTRTGLLAVAVDGGPAETTLEEAVDNGTVINTAGTLVVTDLEVRHAAVIALHIASYTQAVVSVSFHQEFSVVRLLFA